MIADRKKVLITDALKSQIIAFKSFFEIILMFPFRLYISSSICRLDLDFSENVSLKLIKDLYIFFICIYSKSYYINP